MDFLATIRGDEPVLEQVGLQAFELLAPLLTSAPQDPEALAAATSTISRMQRESLAAALLDWWFVTATGGASPLGLAFHLPEVIPPPLRGAMDSVTALAHSGLQIPPGEWVRRARELEELMSQIDGAQELDSYGNSKLPGEREVWSYLQDEIASTVDALRTSRRTSHFDFDERDYEKNLKGVGIVENSRRWNEMLKRAKQCVDTVNHVVAVQNLVEPWKPRDLPTTVDVLPPEIVALGPISQTLLSAVLPPPGHGDVADDDARVSHLLSQVSSGRTTAELSWLAAVCDGWIETTGETIDGLTDVLERRRRISGRIETLRNEAVDVDEAEVLLLDHDLEGAEGHLDAIYAQRKADRRAQAIVASLEHLGNNPEAGSMPEGWADRLAVAERSAAIGDLDGAERIRQELDRDLRTVRRSGAIDELEVIRHSLELLRAPATLLAELDDHISALGEQPDRLPDSALVQRSKERLESIRQQRSQDADRSLRSARELLDGERELIPADALPGLELRLAEAEEEFSVGETMAALDLLGTLLDDINAQRVHRWMASEGEHVLVQHVVNYCTQQVHFDPDDVRRLYVAAKTKPFVILAGLTGSGKSTIARLFAAALGADSHNGRFRRVAVRPDWIDQSEVLGAVNPLNNRFEPGWLATTALQCERNPDQIHVVLLDEMNLAPVEQYLAEYLSALEEARSGADRTRMPLYSSGMAPDNGDDWPPSLAFPLNLIVIGTVNIDETTRVLSDRVLDRANVLQLSVEVSDAHHRPNTRSVQPWHVPFPEWDSICQLQPDDGHHDFLVEVGELLQGVGIGVGQRAHVELERFVTNAEGVLSPERSLDLGVLQRIVPKIRGFKRDLVEGLTELHELLESADCERSAQVVSLWLDDRMSDDEFLDGTDARIGLIR